MTNKEEIKRMKKKRTKKGRKRQKRLQQRVHQGAQQTKPYHQNTHMRKKVIE